jgi:hypothetical protein
MDQTHQHCLVIVIEFPSVTADGREDAWAGSTTYSVLIIHQLAFIFSIRL